MIARNLKKNFVYIYKHIHTYSLKMIEDTKAEDKINKIKDMTLKESCKFFVNKFESQK